MKSSTITIRNQAPITVMKFNIGGEWVSVPDGASLTIEVEYEPSSADGKLHLEQSVKTWALSLLK